VSDTRLQESQMRDSLPRGSRRVRRLGLLINSTGGEGARLVKVARLKN